MSAADCTPASVMWAPVVVGIVVVSLDIRHRRGPLHATGADQAWLIHSHSRNVEGGPLHGSVAACAVAADIPVVEEAGPDTVADIGVGTEECIEAAAHYSLPMVEVACIAPPVHPLSYHTLIPSLVAIERRVAVAQPAYCESHQAPFEPPH